MIRARAVLLDIDGTLADGVGGPALPGAVETVRELARRAPVRFVTNTTSRPRSALAAWMSDLGFDAPEESVVTPVSLARRVLPARGDDRGVLLCEPEARGDLAWFREAPPGEARAVLVATEAHDRAIADLAPAVEALLGGARLYALQQNRVFRRGGRLLTDLGPLAAFLGYAANVPWENLGKPSPLLFAEIAAELGLSPADLAMVGDDAEFDASGAVAAGCGAGILVRTGKYRPGDEDRVAPPPTLVLDDVSRLPDAL